MSLITVNSGKLLIKNLAVLGQEINSLIVKYGIRDGLKKTVSVLGNYYQNTDYDWQQWRYNGPKVENYIKTRVPINKIVPAPGNILGYRFRSIGDNNYPFDMFIITWQPGQKSGIHYHPIYGCSYLTLYGTLNETLYNFNLRTYELEKRGYRIIHQGKSSYINNVIGAHRISNIYDMPAVSLHIYSPRGMVVRNISDQPDIDD